MSDNNTAKILLRLPEVLRRKLKIMAALSNISLNEQIITYLLEGLIKSEEKILSNPKKIFVIEE